MRSLLPLAALLLALPLPARQEPVPAPPFAESIDVEVVNVEVQVTDREGRRVPGLDRGDFELFVDGRPVEIVNFAEVAEGSTVAPKEPLPSAPQESLPAPPGEAAPAAPSEPEPLSLVIYVDNDNLRPFRRNRALQQLGEVLDGMLGPRDRTMLVTREGSLHVRRPLSPGKESLAADLKKLERLATRGVQQDSYPRQTFETIHEFACDREAEAHEAARSYARIVTDEVKQTLNSLENLIESLAGIEGRKAVLYVSDGIPLRPGEDAFALLGALCGNSDPFQAEDVAARLRKVTTLANANGVTLHTLEAAGLRNFSGASAESQYTLLSPEMDFFNTAAVQDSLFNLASETGGRAILNANDFKPDLGKVAGDLRSYYSLGYSPARSGDGRIHRIEVKVRREGLRVRHRTTHRDRPRDERLAARVQTALLHGIVDNPLQARLALVSSVPAERGRHLVTLRLQIPLKRLVLLSQDGFWTGQVSLWLGVRDAKGRIAPVQNVRVPIRVPAAGGEAQLDRPFVYDMR
ncbi:MAG TPA: VWA domain-containing protein, partial [Thermoanaerobaculia bacterium]|nr:VWA domain-containing protein [Thermoanaerobaculia bacterium]